MSEDRSPSIHRAGTLCRSVAATVIAGAWRRKSVHEVRDRLAALPARDEALVIGGVLLMLFLLALFAGQFGPLGLLVYLLAVIVIAN
jgi:hypothetical protein